MHGYISPLDPLGGYNVYHSSGIPEMPPHKGQNETRIACPSSTRPTTPSATTSTSRIVRDAMFDRPGDLRLGPEHVRTAALPAQGRVAGEPQVHNFTGNPSTASGQWNIGDWWLAE